MSSPEHISDQTQPTQTGSPQTPYQRPGKLGDDYDEYGEEMAPNARVWKKYVEETDKSDQELVEGWNGLLDIILIFAALFSAISTAFVIESYKDLKPDPADESAQTLRLISQILLATSTGSPANLSSSIITDTPSFSPTRSAVIVNALWLDTVRQARLRQQRWDGIEYWGMKAVLGMLPLLMHASLLLFAIGLSLFLWDINVQVALPVIVIAGITTLLYLVTGILPFFFRFCPYRTAVTTSLYPCWIPTIEFFWKTPAIIGTLFNWILAFFDLRLHQAIEDYFDRNAENASRWGLRMRETLSTDRSNLVEHETPMDKVTSSMLSWMIANCEDSKSVNIALQALAGADSHLPRESLRECGAIELAAQRLRFYLDSLDNSNAGRPERDSLLDHACLYSSSLNFLIESSQDGLNGLVSLYRYNRTEYIEITQGKRSYETFGCIHSNTLLNHACSGSTPRYEIAALELNNMVFGCLGEINGDLRQAGGRQQLLRQQELLELIITKKLTSLPLAAVLALVSAFTKSCWYNLRQPVWLLVDLLNMTPSETDKPALRHAIGIALTVAAFANHDLPWIDAPPNNDETRLELARQVYRTLSTAKAEQKETRFLLVFGLFELLMEPHDEAIHHESRIRSIRKALVSPLDTRDLELGYQYTIPPLFPDFNWGQRFQQVALHWLRMSRQESDPLEPHPLSLLCLDAILRPSLCQQFGDIQLMIHLMDVFMDTKSYPEELTRICLLAYLNCVSNYVYAPKEVVQHMMRQSLIERLVHLAASSRAGIAPYFMRFIWTSSIQLMYDAQPTNDKENSASLLRMLYDSYNGSLHYQELPQNIEGMRLAERWIHDLIDMCDDDPQNVLRSGVLSEMIQCYKGYGDKHVISQAIELPSRFSEVSTWFAVLQKLEDDCKSVVKRQSNKEGQEEASCVGEDGGAPGGEGISELNNNL